MEKSKNSVLCSQITSIFLIVVVTATIAVSSADATATSTVPFFSSPLFLPYSSVREIEIK